MLASEQQKHKPKQSKIRYTEYYGLQSIFDSLYADSLNGKTFQSLMRLIASEENSKLAYRTIKGNKGGDTPGVDKRTIKDLAHFARNNTSGLSQNSLAGIFPALLNGWKSPNPMEKQDRWVFRQSLTASYSNVFYRCLNQSVKQSSMSVPTASAQTALRDTP